VTIKERREAKGWSVPELAERVGASRRAVQLWEARAVVPLPVYQRRLADVFQVALADLNFTKAPVAA
jgi:transcriptional regulator with XRE-family HTH domain